MPKLKLEYVKLSSIKPWERNPRYNELAVEPVKKSIQEFGMIVPMLLTKKDNTIIAGHTRYLACEQLGIEEVPVIYLEHLTPAQQKAFNIADNKTTQFARWNDDILKELFVELKAENFDLETTGFMPTEIDNLMKTWEADVETISNTEETQEAAPGKIVIKCKQEDESELKDFIELKLKESSFTGVRVE